MADKKPTPIADRSVNRLLLEIAGIFMVVSAVAVLLGPGPMSARLTGIGLCALVLGAPLAFMLYIYREQLRNIERED